MESSGRRLGPPLRLETNVAGQANSATPRRPNLQVSTSIPLAIQPKGQQLYAGDHKREQESKKLLVHVLERLKTRPRAPGAFEPFRSELSHGAGSKMVAAIQSVRSAVRLAKGAPSSTTGINDQAGDSDEEDDGSFSTQMATELLVQLRDTLAVARQLGGNVFTSSTSPPLLAVLPTPSTPQSPFRLRRNSHNSPKGRPKPLKPPPQHAPDLIDDLISTVASIVSEDCRFRVTVPRLKMPPNALQAVVLDVATLLAKMQASEAKVLSALGFAMIPAFYTFAAEMQPKVLAFFEDAILRGMLDDLRLMQGDQPRTAGYRGDSQFPDIQIEQPVDESFSGGEDGPSWRPWTKPFAFPNVLASVAPSQAISVYQLSSLIPPLLAAVLDSVNLDQGSLATLHRFHRLIDLIISFKHDAYLDLLEVAAYHSPTARYTALRALTTFWPKAVGHLVVARPFQPINYAETISSNDQQRKKSQHRDGIYAHEFIPWKFQAETSGQALPVSKPSFATCHVCSETIHDFGLLCSLCTCAVHFNCYDAPGGNFLAQYTSPTDRNTEKIAIARYSLILTPRRDLSVQAVRKSGHYFRMVNLFTLSLCFICRIPLWGTTMQALHCGHCRHFAHSSCLHSTTTVVECHTSRLTAEHICVDWDVLRQTFLDHYRDVLYSQEIAQRKSYEEISILHDVLWMQQQILVNGIVSGSIAVEQRRLRTPVSASETGVDEFELQSTIGLYEDLLLGGQLQRSEELLEYQGAAEPSAPAALPKEPSILFDWSFLSYVAAFVKAPLQPRSMANPRGLLRPDGPIDFAQDISDATHPFEVVTLSHMRDALAHTFRVFNDAAARELLIMMYNLGLFRRIDLEPDMPVLPDVANKTHCVFPLPLAVDVSNTVEILFSAMEACFSDLDISVNECGFLLLVRRCWPTVMSTDYALARLTRMVLRWTFAEDDRLILIARDYLTRRKPLPGVRGTTEAKPWPTPASTTRSGSSTSINSGGDYVACRKLLLTRYASKWLLALHDQDPAMYARLIYEQCDELAQDADHTFNTDSTLPSEEQEHIETQRKVTRADVTLRHILKLDQSGVVFSTFDNLIMRWLEAISVNEDFSKPVAFRSLTRVFNRDADSARRSITEATLSTQDSMSQHAVDPWQVIISVASEDLPALEQAIRWLLVLARSGVNVPTPVFVRVAALCCDMNAPFHQCIILSEAMVDSIWTQAREKHRLLDVISDLHSFYSPTVRSFILRGETAGEITRFLRHSLASCLLLYGCDRDVLLSSKLIELDDVKSLSGPRRTAAARSSLNGQRPQLDTKFVQSLTLYLVDGSDDIHILVAKFLNILFNASQTLDSHFIDDFILINGRVLADWVWRFYDVQSLEMSTLRISLLLRVLVVDALPFEDLLAEIFRAGKATWEERFHAVARLFRIVLDVNNPAFQVEGRQWRGSVVSVFIHFFSSQWMDAKEQVRLTTETLSRTLLPAHFNAIALCFDEHLSNCSIPEQINLVAFLVQLHPHFPKWRVLSWEVTVEALARGDEQGDDADLSALKVSLVDLGLQLVADGITADLFSLLKIKYTLVKLLGFQDVALVPNGRTHYVQFDHLQALPEGSYPCVHSLMRALDATVPCYLPPSSMGGHGDDAISSALTGTIFVDVVLVLVTTINLTTLPYLICRSCIESLVIILYKHDFQTPLLSHWNEPLANAVRRVTDLLLVDVSADIRQLALSAARAYFKRSQQTVSGLLSQQISTVSQYIVTTRSNSEELLLAQCKGFLDEVFTKYSSRGIFWVLFKRELPPHFFDVLHDVLKDHVKENPNESSGFNGESLRDAVVRDTFQQILHHPNEHRILNIVTANLARYVDVVHHQSYPSSLLEFVGLSLTGIARWTAEWDTDAFDPNPLLSLSAMIAQHHKAHSRDLLLHTETLLRSALVRFHVEAGTLSKLLQVTATISRRASTVNGHVPLNHFAPGMLDLLQDALQVKTRISAKTLHAMLEVVLASGATSRSYFSREDVVRLAAYGIPCLQASVFWAATLEGFTANTTVAQLILEASIYNSSLLINTLSLEMTKPGFALPVRIWNYLALSALEAAGPGCASNLLVFLSAFSHSYASSLASHLVKSPFGGGPSDLATSDINQAYSGLKLWLLLARKKFSALENDADSRRGIHGANEDQGQLERRIWSDLWPPFSRLVTASVDLAGSELYTSICAFVWSTLADIVLFVQTSQSIIALDASQRSLWQHILTLPGAERLQSKLTRAAHNQSELPDRLPFQVLLEQARADFVIAEKLLSLETRKREDRRRDPSDRR